MAHRFGRAGRCSAALCRPCVLAATAVQQHHASVAPHCPPPRPADDPSGRWRQAQQALADNPRTARLAAVGLLGAELLALAAACALQAIYQQAYEAWMDDREVGWVLALGWLLKFVCDVAGWRGWAAWV